MFSRPPRLELHLVAVSLLLGSFVHSQSCVQYPSTNVSSSQSDASSNICSGIVNYSVFIPQNASLPAVEASLAPLAQVAPLKLLYPECAQAYAKWACTLALPRCIAESTVQFPCKSLCEDALNQCTEPFTLLQQSQLLPNCQAIPRLNITYPETSCVSSDDVGSWTYSNPQAADLTNSPLLAGGCPSPFVSVTAEELASLDETTRKKCLGSCCLPCPFSDSLYPPGSMELVRDILSYVRLVSAVLALFVLVSYVILPGYQAKPRDLILYIAAGIFLWQATVFFSVGDTKRVSCVDKFTSATQQNSILCASQGSIILFGVYSVIFWSVCLIMNLHLHLVWKKNYVDRAMPFLRVICFLGPLALAIVPLVLGYINYEFGETCFITDSQSSYFFFYPLAAIIFPMFLVHMITFVTILRASFKAAKSTSANNTGTNSGSQGTTLGPGSSGKRSAMMIGIRMQWRPVALAFVITAIFMLFWLFHLLQLEQVLGIDPQTTEWVQQWILCLFRTQLSNIGKEETTTPFDTCENIISPFVPSFVFQAITQVAVGTAGIWLFFILGFRRELFVDWGNFIGQGCCCGVRRRKKRDVEDQRRRRTMEDVRSYAQVDAVSPTAYSASSTPRIPYGGVPQPVPASSYGYGGYRDQGNYSVPPSIPMSYGIPPSAVPSRSDYFDSADRSNQGHGWNDSRSEMTGYNQMGYGRH